jgi:hypothetical protein
MVTGTSLKRDDFLSVRRWGFSNALHQGQLEIGMRIIVIRAWGFDEVLVEGWITEIGSATITIRTPEERLCTGSFEYYGFPEAYGEKYDHNTTFALRSTWLRRHRFTRKKRNN